ncbi:histidine kinase [Tenacibaculum holothuriorum]|uniref:histidine kinase n=1 Tax=Tenacibaculum holothuriorum TaxID=1635173 RepID=A0A1Y2PAN7_9FLAO|nr:HAMP domain-containing sensor histidine kinase [Tenacibaculum holothuriorum]OSY87220.1 histidine kinase [Tenacibaculum holothuriorum]
MSFFNNTFWLKRIAIGISLIIVSFILWNTYVFFQKFKQEERIKVETYADAIEELNTTSVQDLDKELSPLVLKIITEKTKDIPFILVNAKGEITESFNLDSIKAKDPQFLKEQLAIMKNQNKPISINYLGKTDFIYYKDSSLIDKLTYYPLALLLILGLFLSVIYLFFSSNKIAEQNKLWTGMAKETAHQIGTPLSSLLGWIEILKTENIDQSYVGEMQKDVDRLSTIANRFSKIGSTPKLEKQNIVTVTKSTFDYLESRSSKQVSFAFSSQNNELFSNINSELFGWVIENLVKNAIDAMQGKGNISLEINNTVKHIKILISDTGKGIPKSKFKQIFKPGFTTKKRGWGLGLSLSKRIIEDYHDGKIQVLKSELGKGTSFEIVLNKTN